MLPPIRATAPRRPVRGRRRRWPGAALPLRRWYAYRLGSAADADLFLTSLYLPDLAAARYRAALAVLRAAARCGVCAGAGPAHRRV
jgi:hypothetical protein